MIPALLRPIAAGSRRPNKADDDPPGLALLATSQYDNFSAQAACAPVAQLDRVLDYESRGREFESSPVRHSQVSIAVFQGRCGSELGFSLGRPDGGPTCDYAIRTTKVQEMATSHSKKPYRKKAGAIFNSIN